MAIGGSKRFQRRRLCGLCGLDGGVVPGGGCRDLGLLPDAESRASDCGSGDGSEFAASDWRGPSALHAADQLSGEVAGYLWQGRFASFVMDEPYLVAATRYVELNPVRAGLVADAAGGRGAVPSRT